MQMNRYQRRAQAKQDRKSFAGNPMGVLANLSGVANRLQEIVAAGDQVGALAAQLTEVLDQVQQTRDSFGCVLEEAAETKYEVERQRFVALRLVGTINPVDPNNFAALLALEEQYRAEYDALQGLLKLVQLVKDVREQ